MIFGLTLCQCFHTGISFVMALVASGLLLLRMMFWVESSVKCKSTLKLLFQLLVLLDTIK